MKNDTQTVKKLQSQVNSIDAEIVNLKSIIGNKQRELSLQQNNKNELIRRIKAMDNPSAPTVSEHAIVRYFERVKGFNIEEVKKEILDSNVLTLIETLGTSGTYPATEFSVVLKNNVVVTIV